MSHKALVKLVKKITFASPAILEMKPTLLELHAVAYAVATSLKEIPAELPEDMIFAIAKSEADRFLRQYLCVA